MKTTRNAHTGIRALAPLGLALLALTLESRPALADSATLDPEPENSGWSLYIDNDALLPINRDEDYTGGLAVTLGGRRAADAWYSLDKPLGWVDDSLDNLIDFRADNAVRHSIQFGAVAFTPNSLKYGDVQPGERPYASLAFIANGRNYVGSRDEPAYHTTLTVGMLGLRIASGVQAGIHKAIGATDPAGWSNQISNGGEPTFRYTVARQDLQSSHFTSRNTEYELKTSYDASIGYLTEASAAVSLRWGVLNTPWWSFPPERVEYIAEPSAIVTQQDVTGPGHELYLWTGAKVSAVGYNAFLQGQFRDSPITYSESEIRHLIAQVWGGVTWQFNDAYRLSWVVRYQTSELRHGPGDREVVWGSVFLSRSL